ncbi:MAG: cyclic nucleotide-binding domain-containing protein [Spirochaetes bacterium]|jgi:CRP-like cAMP-binding protein|nr:cyclic nucleotide-binding domain-containing protein [Spirochaetota bacterium]
MGRTEDEIRDKLRQIHLFASIRDDEEALERFRKITRLTSESRGTVMIREGDVGAEMYIVYRGAVEIQKRTRAGDNYTVVRLSSEDNVFFGELALVDDDKRSATVIATEDSEFIVISKTDFVKLGDERPDIGLPITREIAKILASRLRKTTGDMLTIFDALVSELQQ